MADRPFCVNARFLSQRITGSQRYCIEIARWLRRLDPGIRFLAPRDVRHRELAEELGAEVVGRRRGVGWEQWDLPRWLRRHGSPRLVSMQYTAPLGYDDTVVTIHDVVYRNRAWVSWRFHWWYRFLIPRVARRARRVVTVSEFSKGEITAALGIPADRIDVVYGAVAPDFGGSGEAPPNRYGRYVLGVGTVNRRKNLARLVRAFRRTADREVRLVLVGAQDARVYGRDRELAGLLDDPRVVLAGRVPDAELARLYRDALLFAFPSLYEGFGIPPVEAMSLGCPVLTSSTSSLPEICGDAARYVDPLDEAAITAAIDELVRDAPLRERLRAKGLERARAFDWQRSARAFLEIARGA